MQEIFYFVKRHFQQSENVIMKLIIINIAVFLTLLFLKFFLIILNQEIFYQNFCKYTFLPGTYTILLQQPWSILSYFFINEHFFSVIDKMFLLYFFGYFLTHFRGNTFTLTLYILGGIFSGLLLIFIKELSPQYSNAQNVATSSGAVYSIIGSLISMDLQLKIRFLFIQINLKKIIIYLLIYNLFVILTHTTDLTYLLSLLGVFIGFGFTRMLDYFQRIFS